MNVDEILDTARIFRIPMAARFRGITVREGVLFAGPAGWAEFAPFLDYDDAECVPWLRAAVHSATTPWPAAVRTTVPVNVTVPEIGADQAFVLVEGSGCRTAKVKVAGRRPSLDADVERVAAAAAALRFSGRVRVDANGGWDVQEAIVAIRALDQAAHGLEYVEQPCRTIAELAEVRRRVDVPIAADESIRRESDPLAVARAGAADIAVIKVAPLGGVSRALEICADAGLPAVVSSAVDTAVGISAGLALAGALPELPYACGLATRSLLRWDVSSSGSMAVAGLMAVPTRAPEPDLLEHHPVNPERQQFWLDRLRRVAALTN